MKIGILTFHCATNYGAILQTYGLQEYLRSLRHEVYVLDYRPDYLLTPYKVFAWQWSSSYSVLRNLFFLLRAILAYPIRLKRQKGFDNFIRRHIYLCSSDCLHVDSDFDAFIFGSDQIWNPCITGVLDKIYFGKFSAAEGKRLMAYAASAGSVGNLTFCKKDFFSLLSSYTAVSVREKSLADFIRKEIPKKNITPVIDPVLLTGKKTFEALTCKQKMSKKYLLVFQLYYNVSLTCWQVAEKVAKEKGLQIIKLVSNFESLLRSDIISAASPKYFITLFKNADYILTTSYHGMIFSLLFEKDFNVFYSSTCGRMVDLLSELNLSDRLVKDEWNIVLERIDYTKVNKRLEEIRLRSQAFIEDSLTSPQVVQQ